MKSADYFGSMIELLLEGDVMAQDAGGEMGRGMRHYRASNRIGRGETLPPEQTSATGGIWLLMIGLGFKTM